MANGRPGLNFGFQNNEPTRPVTGAVDSSFIYNPTGLTDETIAYICDDKNIVERIYDNTLKVKSDNDISIVNKSHGNDGKLYIVKWNTKDHLRLLGEHKNNYKKYIKLLEGGFDFIIPLLYAKTNYKKEGDMYYSVMITEYIPGQTLEKFPADTLEYAHIMSIIEQLKGCLGSLSSRGFVHRDIKPENIFIHIRDEGFKVYLIDFDILCNTGHLAESEKFMTCRLFPDDTIKGTHKYARPNSTPAVRKGPNYVYTPKNDLYSLGIVIKNTLSYISKGNKGDLENYGEAMMLENIQGGRRKTNRRKYKSIKRRKTIKKRY
jgi:serine/threonine protein kinase